MKNSQKTKILRTGRFSPVIRGPSDIFVSGVTPFHQRLHYNEEVHSCNGLKKKKYMRMTEDRFSAQPSAFLLILQWASCSDLKGGSGVFTFIWLSARESANQKNKSSSYSPTLRLLGSRYSKPNVLPKPGTRMSTPGGASVLRVVRL